MEPTVELDKYRERAELEKKNGYPEIADFWEKAANAAQEAIDVSCFFGKHLDLKTIPLLLSPQEKFQASQQAAKYSAQFLKAMNAGDVVLAQQYTAAAARCNDAQNHYEYWKTRAHQEAVEAHFIKEEEASAMAVYDRTQEIHASSKNNSSIAQQWAEAACLAQEATNKAKKRDQLFLQKENPCITHALLMSAYWTFQAARLRADVAKAIEQGDKKKIKHAAMIAMAAEDAATYRSKAARAVRQKDSTLFEYWTMAAYWAATSSLHQQKKDPSRTCASILAQRASRAYASAARNKIRTPRLSFLVSFWLKRAARAEGRIINHKKSPSAKATTQRKHKRIFL